MDNKPYNKTHNLEIELNDCEELNNCEELKVFVQFCLQKGIIKAEHLLQQLPEFGIYKSTTHVSLVATNKFSA
jgi:adenine C2-methylase RlmN of 23S rRNA A2503 and tRNA A37